MPSIRNTLFVVASFLMAVLASGPAFGVERLSLSHVRQISDEPPALRLYLDATNSEGESLRGLSAEGLQVSLGQELARTESLRPFEDSGEGIAYIFLVDVSRSLTEAQFGKIRDALEAWILDFGEKDWGAVIAFGETSRLVVDFTSDWRRLRDGLDSLGPTDNLTLFHQALDDGIELSLRKDPGMPGRRVIVVLTDGLDEGSGLSLEDVVARLRENPVSIHAIGYSRLKPESRRQEFLDVLQRLASNSGGTFFEAQQTDFAESYAEIRKAIRRVWVADISCPSCPADGQVYRLQANLAIGSRVLSRGTDVRLLPMAPSARTAPVSLRDPAVASSSPAVADGGAPSATAPDAGANSAGSSSPGAGGEAPQRASKSPAPSSSGEAGEKDTAPKKGWWQAVPWWVYALTGLMLALFVGMLSGFNRREETEEGTDPQEAPEEAGTGAAAETPPLSKDDPSLRQIPEIPLGLEGTGSARPRSVRLVVVRGSRKGKEYRLTLEDRAVVGARSTCDCVLTDEEGVAPEQFELVQKDNHVLLRNLATTNPTRMGGHAVQDLRRIRSNDLVGTAEMILRVILEP